VGRCLDQTRDDRRFGQGDAAGRVPEELAARSIDASSAMAQTASLTLRVSVRLLLRNRLRASCWVIVDVARIDLPLVSET
jgi:hypothetical protein